MPSKNIVRNFAEQSYYHVYNRGVEKRIIFLDDLDYQVFLSLLKGALSPEKPDDLVQHEFVNMERIQRLRLFGDVKLMAYCLMPNHFHLFLYQEAIDGVQRLMQSIGTAYTVYFNKRYERVGRLFQGTYKASEISNDSYYWHIARYIHLNPEGIGKDHRTYEYSSLRHAHEEVNWLSNEVVDMHGGLENYLRFLNDFSGYRRSFEDIKPILADA